MITATYIKDAIITIERGIESVKHNLSTGNTATAALLLQDLARNMTEQANEIVQDLVDAMPEKERRARLAAFEYYKSNCGMGDWEEEYNNNPYFLDCTPAEIADSLRDLFENDLPTDIINDLRAC